MLEHGGRLRAAARRYGIPESDWLDLSTGINPNGWPVPEIPARAWRRLPEEEDGLEDAACAYYGARNALPVAGSQAAIQILPLLRSRSRVAIITPGYNEHAHAWRNAGHDVILPAPEEFIARAADCDAAVLIHPNNPTGSRYPRAEISHLHERLAERGGWLIVDEAFMDATPEDSVTPLAHMPGLIVLRSLGKFFGLAGARVGFVCAEPGLLAQLRARLGPWAVAGPSRWVAERALRDGAWQHATRVELAAAQSRLLHLLSEHGLAPHRDVPVPRERTDARERPPHRDVPVPRERPPHGCALFHWVCDARAAQWHEQLAAQGILTRLFHEPPSLRFGLPGREQDWNRLRTALREIAS